MSEQTTPSQLEGRKSGIWGGEYPTIVDLLAILGIFLIAQIISLTVTHMLGYGFSREALASGDVLVREAAQYEAGMYSLVSYLITISITIFAALLLRWIRGGKAPVAKFSYRGFNPSVLLWSIVMLICVAIIFDPLMRLLPSPPELVGRGWAMVVTLIVVAPVFEELLCRGIILESIRAKWGVWAACLLSSVMFAVMHFHPSASINALVVGIILSYIYVRSDSLFAPIILHAFNNALAYMLIWLGFENITLRDIITNRDIYTAVYIAAAVILIFSLVKIIRQLSRIRREGLQNEVEEPKSEI